MEKQLIISVPNASGGEEGLTIACKTGNLFRGDEKLEDLYRDGFRIYDYAIEEVKEKKPRGLKETLVRVFLKK
ncbi:MAG TPA: hypothetical protein VNS32_20885 [Flavisolibacter sp.]|nr:hypothetical protein [Flavisolibacter sp.]